MKVHTVDTLIVALQKLVANGQGSHIPVITDRSNPLIVGAISIDQFKENTQYRSDNSFRSVVVMKLESAK